MGKKSRKKLLVLFLFLFTFLFFSFLVKISEHIIIKKIFSASSGTVKISSISMRFPSILAKKINVYTPFVSFFMKELRVRPVFTRNAFAFTGPGDIMIREKKRSISIKGSATGSIKGKTLNIRTTDVVIDKVGSLEIKGLLENWGKDSINATMELKGIEVDEIKNIFDLKLPFTGRVFGKADFESDEKEKSKKIKFDVNIKDITTSEKGRFDAFLKGLYDIAKGTAEIYQGSLLSPSGGKIFFSGTIDREKFNLNFETEEMDIEEFLKLLPEEIKSKYNLAAKGGTADMNGFEVERIKKNFGLTAFFPFTSLKFHFTA